jgi:hypothetical protein
MAAASVATPTARPSIAACTLGNSDAPYAAGVNAPDATFAAESILTTLVESAIATISTTAATQATMTRRFGVARGVAATGDCTLKAGGAGTLIRLPIENAPSQLHVTAYENFFQNSD